MSASSFYRIHVRKEALKFSSAHMTVFPDGTKERMHGHNYFPELHLTLRDTSFEAMLPFAEVKRAMKVVSAAWDEKFLLAERNPFLKRQPSREGEVEFLLCGERYVLPEGDVICLPLDNITTETLSERYFTEWKEALPPAFPWGNILDVEVRVEEIGGQGASYHWVNS